MTATMAQGQKAKLLIAVLLFVILAGRVLVPAGFMPVATSQGVVVMLCTGQGPMTVTVDRAIAGKPAKPAAPAPVAGDHCPYAGGVSASTLPAALADAALPAWQGAHGAIAFALKTGWIARLAAPPPPSSGPPATA